MTVTCYKLDGMCLVTYFVSAVCLAAILKSQKAYFSHTGGWSRGYNAISCVLAYLNDSHLVGLQFFLHDSQSNLHIISQFATASFHQCAWYSKPPQTLDRPLTFNNDSTISYLFHISDDISLVTRCMCPSTTRRTPRLLHRCWAYVWQ